IGPLRGLRAQGCARRSLQGCTCGVPGEGLCAHPRDPGRLRSDALRSPSWLRRDRAPSARRTVSRARALFFDGVVDGESRAGLRDAPQADDALARERRAVAADEDLLPRTRLHERAVRALVDQRELVAARLDARMQPR